MFGAVDESSGMGAIRVRGKRVDQAGTPGSGFRFDRQGNFGNCEVHERTTLHLACAAQWPRFDAHGILRCWELAYATPRSPGSSDPARSKRAHRATLAGWRSRRARQARWPTTAQQRASARATNYAARVWLESRAPQLRASARAVRPQPRSPHRLDRNRRALGIRCDSLRCRSFRRDWQS